MLLRTSRDGKNVHFTSAIMAVMPAMLVKPLLVITEDNPIIKENEVTNKERLKHSDIGASDRVKANTIFVPACFIND